MHPGHDITVTGGGPFGRAWFDCSCGITRVFASKVPATHAALVHHHDVGGCNCPQRLVIEFAIHPDPPSTPTVPGPGSPAPVVDAATASTRGADHTTT